MPAVVVISMHLLYPALYQKNSLYLVSVRYNRVHSNEVLLSFPPVLISIFLYIVSFIEQFLIQFTKMTNHTVLDPVYDSTLTCS